MWYFLREILSMNYSRNTHFMWFIIFLLAGLVFDNHVVWTGRGTIKLSQHWVVSHVNQSMYNQSRSIGSLWSIRGGTITAHPIHNAYFYSLPHNTYYYVIWNYVACHQSGSLIFVLGIVVCWPLTVFRLCATQHARHRAKIFPISTYISMCKYTE